MADYKVIFLTSGQIPPKGSTGVMISSGGIMWYGDAFSESALLGFHTDTDPLFDTTYTYSAATVEEIQEYLTLVSGIQG
jgi:hypothetical protein